VTGKEQYYTPPRVADEIIDSVAQFLPDLHSRTLLEPAGGTGAFINPGIAAGFKQVVSFDIEPHHELVQSGDFLEQRLDLSGCVTVSNPPFGRNNSLSIPFFNKAAEVSDLIVFIVPRSWRKWTVQNKLHKNFHLVRDDDLSIDYVDASGKLLSTKNNLRTCVQYWLRKPEVRDPIYVKDMGIIERCGFEDADATFTLFGYGCGSVKTDFPRKSNTTQMFIRLKHPRALEALQVVEFSKFFMHTAYTEALSIQEINFLLNEYLFGDPMLTTENTRRKKPAENPNTLF
jgi:predicted RNA methylase